MKESIAVVVSPEMKKLTEGEHRVYLSFLFLLMLLMLLFDIAYFNKLFL